MNFHWWDKGRKEREHERRTSVQCMIPTTIGHPQNINLSSPFNTNSPMTPSEREHRPGSFVRVDFFSRATTTATSTTAAFSAFTPFARLLGLFGVRHLSVVRHVARAGEAKKDAWMRWINLVPLLKFSVWEN